MGRPPAAILDRMRVRPTAVALFVFGSCASGAACGDVLLDQPTFDGGVAHDAESDAMTTTGVVSISDTGASSDVGRPPTCVPGQSVACVGSGGCASNQICNESGTGLGTCACAPT